MRVTVKAETPIVPDIVVGQLYYCRDTPDLVVLSTSEENEDETFSAVTIASDSRSVGTHDDDWWAPCFARFYGTIVLEQGA